MTNGVRDAVDELAEVIPSLRRSATGARTAVADERYRAHRVVRRLLELLAAERPLVLVLDDLHWSDGASIELLGGLLRRGPGRACAVRGRLPARQAPARLSAAVAAPATRRIALEQLSEAQATQLLAELDPRAVAAIYRHGGGNPFYLEQLARSGDGETLATAPGATGRAPTAPAFRRRSPHRLPRSSRRSRRASACCSSRRRSRASRSSPISPR